MSAMQHRTRDLRRRRGRRRAGRRDGGARSRPARAARSLLLDRAGRIKPCGGAIPPRADPRLRHPRPLLVARITSARMVSPAATAGRHADRRRLRRHGRPRAFRRMAARARRGGRRRRAAPAPSSASAATSGRHAASCTTGAGERRGERDASRARLVIGADGRDLAGRRAQEIPARGEAPLRLRLSRDRRAARRAGAATSTPTRCDVYYRGALSPDFYAWVFPHGETISIGTGTRPQGLLAARRRRATCAPRPASTGGETLRREGAPDPAEAAEALGQRPRRLLAGDAAGIVAPASGEGIYYAMLGGRLAAEAADACLAPATRAALAQARKPLHEGARPRLLDPAG